MRPTTIALTVATIACIWLTVGALTGGWAVLTVPTGSMRPTIPIGAGVIVRTVPTGEVRTGDVIVFRAPGTGVLTVHRIAAIERDDGHRIMRTKGDANPVEDPWRAKLDGPTVHRVQAVVPGIGTLTGRLGSPWIRATLAVAGAALLLGGGLRAIWGARTHDRDEPDDGHEPDDRDEPSEQDAPHDTDTTPDTGTDQRGDNDGRVIELVAPGRGVGVRVGRPVALVVVAGLLGLVAAGSAFDRAEAAFLGASGAPASVSSGLLAAPTAASCRWTTGTAIQVSWTPGVGGIGTGSDVVRTTLALGSPTVAAATSPVSVATASVTAPAPVTTPYLYSVRTTRSPWTSAPTASLRSDACSNAVTALAGSGTAGSTGDGGAATSALLNQPRDVAVSADGTVYIADTINNRIRRVSAGGTITTFAGGPAASACTYTGAVSGLGLNGPRGVAVDGSGNVYIVDTGQNCVRKVDTAGNVTRVAGGGVTSTCNSTAVAATSLLLAGPAGVAVDPSTGDLIITETTRNCVRRISAGTATLVAGGGATTACNSTSVAATSLLLAGPAGVAVDPTTGAVIVADTGRSCVRRIAGGNATLVAGGGATTACSTTGPASAVSLSAPEGVDVDPTGRVVISDTGRSCLRQVSGATVSPLGFTGTAGSTGDGGPVWASLVRSPAGPAIDVDGDVLVSDRSSTAGSNRVRAIRTPLS